MTLDRAVDIILDVLPNSIDITPNGEFVCDDTSYGDLEYFENSQAIIQIVVQSKNEISINYSGDDDETYFVSDDCGYDLLIIDKFDEDEFKYKIIAMFSETFGWVEKFGK